MLSKTTQISVDIQDLACFKNGPKFAYLRSIFGAIASTFTEQGSLDSLSQMYLEYAKQEDKLMEITVKPGNLGFDFENENGNGYITRIDSSDNLEQHLNDKGVEEGWQITKINDRRFSTRTLEIAMEASADYTLTFESPADHITPLCFHSILEVELKSKFDSRHADYLFATIAGKSKRMSRVQFLNECTLCSFFQNQNKQFDAFFKAIALSDGNMYRESVLQFLERNSIKCNDKMFTKQFQNLFDDSADIEKFKEMLFTQITDELDLISKQTLHDDQSKISIPRWQSTTISTETNEDSVLDDTTDFSHSGHDTENRISNDVEDYDLDDLENTGNRISNNVEDYDLHDLEDPASNDVANSGAIEPDEDVKNCKEKCCNFCVIL
jgi:hypothetical protein